MIRISEEILKIVSHFIEGRNFCLFETKKKMASFVSVSSDEEQVAEIARYLNKLLMKGQQEPNENFLQEINKLHEEKKFIEEFSKLIEESGLVFADSVEKDIESFFLVLISLARKLKPETESIAALTKIQNKLISNTEDKSQLRLKLLDNLYNIVEDQVFRYNLYIEVIKYANSSHNTELLIKEFSSESLVNSRIKQWKINVEQVRALYKLVRDTFKTSGRVIEAYKWSVKFISTFENVDPSQFQEAASLALEAIRIPTLLEFDSLLELPLINQLEKSKDHGKLFQLLKIFVSENFEAYKIFIAGNVDYLKSIGLKEEDCTLKMRLLSLATLGAASQEIPYSLIAKTLQIEENEVENWVILAMSENILEAKMDQLRCIVTISWCLQRVFTKIQWKQLNDNLLSWRNSTKNILSTLQQATKQITFQQKLSI